MKKFKIVIDTDGDIGVDRVSPYFYESDFEEITSKELTKEELIPYLIASQIMCTFLPYYYNYHFEELLSFADDIYDDPKKIEKSFLYNKVDDKEYFKKIISHFIETTKDCIKFIDDGFDYHISMGNQNIEVINLDRYNKLNEIEKKIYNVLQDEFKFLLDNNELMRITKKIYNSLKENK